MIGRVGLVWMEAGRAAELELCRRGKRCERTERLEKRKIAWRAVSRVLLGCTRPRGGARVRQELGR